MKRYQEILCIILAVVLMASSVFPLITMYRSVPDMNDTVLSTMIFDRLDNGILYGSKGEQVKLKYISLFSADKFADEVKQGTRVFVRNFKSDRIENCTALAVLAGHSNYLEFDSVISYIQHRNNIALSLFLALLLVGLAVLLLGTFLTLSHKKRDHKK